MNLSQLQVRVLRGSTSDCTKMEDGTERSMPAARVAPEGIYEPAQLQHRLSHRTSTRTRSQSVPARAEACRRIRYADQGVKSIKFYAVTLTCLAYGSPRATALKSKLRATHTSTPLTRSLTSIQTQPRRPPAEAAAAHRRRHRANPGPARRRSAARRPLRPRPLRPRPVQMAVEVAGEVVPRQRGARRPT